MINRVEITAKSISQGGRRSLGHQKSILLTPHTSKEDFSFKALSMVEIIGLLAVSLLLIC